MNSTTRTSSDEIARLNERLAELEETIAAIRAGQVDALVDGKDVFLLESAETASNRFRGQVLQQISENGDRRGQRLLHHLHQRGG
jgi:hypothetical protein